jgi:1-acyl-sn-glycerol-3-phosphate acyltransferase
MKGNQESRKMDDSYSRTENNKGGDRKNGAEPFVLPESVLTVIRRVGKRGSRVLWNIKYKGVENVPSSGGLIIAANHQTYFDPFWLGFPIERPLRFLAWDASFNWPVVGKFMAMFGAWPLQLDRSDPSAIRRTIQWLKKGGAIVIFPEGGRGNPDGSMIKFKHGAVRMAIESGVPILPVTISGAHRVWPSTNRFPRLGPVEVTYHPPYEVKMIEGEDNRLCARRESEKLASVIRGAL